MASKPSVVGVVMVMGLRVNRDMVTQLLYPSSFLVPCLCHLVVPKLLLWEADLFIPWDWRWSWYERKPDWKRELWLSRRDESPLVGSSVWSSVAQAETEWGICIKVMGRVKQVQYPVATQTKFLSRKIHLECRASFPENCGQWKWNNCNQLSLLPWHADGSRPSQTWVRLWLGDGVVVSLLRTGCVSFPLRGIPVALSWPWSSPSNPWEVQHVAGIIVHSSRGGAFVLHVL